MVLDTVPYASNGSFAVNLWMRRLPGSNTSGDAFQYLYSHTGVAKTSGQSPNQARRGGWGLAGCHTLARPIARNLSLSTTAICLPASMLNKCLLRRCARCARCRCPSTWRTAPTPPMEWCESL